MIHRIPFTSFTSWQIVHGFLDADEDNKESDPCVIILEDDDVDDNDDDVDDIDEEEEEDVDLSSSIIEELHINKDEQAFEPFGFLPEQGTGVS